MNVGVMLLNRFKELRKKFGYSQKDLAALLYVNQTAVSQWERGLTTPTTDTLLKLCEIYNTTVDYILGRTDDPINYNDDDLIANLRGDLIHFFDGDVKRAYTAQKAIRDDSLNEFNIKSLKIPILGTIPAGIPIEAIEDILGFEELDPDMVQNGHEYFGLKIKGNSMFPTYMDGDVIIVQKQDSAESGDDAVVIVNGDDATFKRITITDDSVILKPLNPEYEPLFFTKEQAQKLPVCILGVAVEIRRKIK